MRISQKALLRILLATTLSPFVTAAHAPQLAHVRLPRCDNAAISTFLPPPAMPLGSPFMHYVEHQSVCDPPPLLTSFDEKKRFESNYKRFAYYFNQNLHSSVPETCRIRFQGVGQSGFKKLPDTWEGYERGLKKVCGGAGGAEEDRTAQVSRMGDCMMVLFFMGLATTGLMALVSLMWRVGVDNLPVV